MDKNTLSHTRWECKYHIVFAPKYRRQVIYGKIREEKTLSMGGADSVENLSCTCEPCNLFKGNISPDTFFERISMIYLYQMEKKYKGKLKWKIIHRILEKMI